MRGHTLEWGEAYRNMTEGKLQPGEAPFWAVAAKDCGVYWRALEQRVKRDVALFKGQFGSYDVLNEVGACLRACGSLVHSFVCLHQLLQLLCNLQLHAICNAAEDFHTLTHAHTHTNTRSSSKRRRCCAPAACSLPAPSPTCSARRPPPTLGRSSA